MRPLFLMAAFIAGLQSSPLCAASLRVSPVLVDLSAPTVTSSLRVWNDATRPINVQVRIFRWSQENGTDVYTPATDVVASPPMTQLKSGGENIIRIVRTAKTQARAEESYRVIVDELPDAGSRKAGTVNLVIRHSIPVFFSRSDINVAKATWSITRKSGGYEVSVTNSGNKRMRIANLALLNAGGGAIARQQGLVGYVLGRSTASWFISAAGGKTGGGTLTISAESESGPVNVKSNVKGG